MKQIKTIWWNIENSEIFDNETNEALANGWELKERKVFVAKEKNDNRCSCILLYAELEIDKEPETKGELHDPA